jgi:hypothetical protein
MPQPFLVWGHTRKLTDFKSEKLFYSDRQNLCPFCEKFNNSFTHNQPQNSLATIIARVKA